MILQNFKIAILQNVGEQPFLKVDYHIIFMINEIDLFVVSAKFHSIGNIFPFWDQIFSWNEKIDICFNVECVLLCRNFDFLGGYWSLPSGYYWLLLVIWWLLLVTTCYGPFPLLV